MFRFSFPQFNTIFDDPTVVHLPSSLYKPKYVEITAIQLRMPITYELWGGTQTGKVGDWLVEKGNDTYTIDGTEFATSYQKHLTKHATYFKAEHIEAYEVRCDGYIETLEGRSKFKAGDYLACSPTGKTWCLTAKTLAEYYDLV